MQNNNINMTYHNLSERLKRDLKSNFNHNGNLVCENNIIYLEFYYVKKSIELYKDSIEVVEVAKKLCEVNGIEANTNNLKRLTCLIKRKFDFYQIDLFALTKRYITISIYKDILNGNEDFKRKESITMSELLDKINSLFCCVEYDSNHILFKMIKEHNIEVFDTDYKYNFIGFNQLRLPKDSVEKLIELFREYVKAHIHLINISFEELSLLKESNFNEIYRELNEDDIKVIRGVYKAFTNKPKQLKRAFEDTNIKVIHLYTWRRMTYVSKKEIDEFVNSKRNYIHAHKYLSEHGCTQLVGSVAKNNGIHFEMFNNTYYATKSELDKYLKQFKYNLEYINAESLYDRVNLKIINLPHKREKDFPKVKELILDFTKQINSNSKVTLNAYTPAIYDIYNIILDNIKFDLIKENKTYNNELFERIIKMIGYNSKLMLISFINYLKEKKKFDLNGFINTRENKKIKPYKAENFINLLSYLLEIIYDENKFKKLYRNWNLSSTFLYVFLHFSLAWRRNDILTQIPIIDLKLIDLEIDNGESFIRWLEEGNKLSFEDCKYICKLVEERTNRLREKANKNKVQLRCIICDVLIEPIAILLTINEANRQIHTNKYKNLQKYEKCMNIKYTVPTKIQEQFTKYFDIDIEEILEGTFDNRRMNKGFLTLVVEKAEELNLFGYYITQLLRGHKFDRKKLSETTKIYLEKNTDINSVMAFSAGTMGSVNYLLNQLVDENFDKKNIEEKLLAMDETNLTPYAIEKNIKIISNKLSTLQLELKEYFTNNGDKKILLEDLLYGQSFYGIEERTKCLLKITRKENCITRIAPIDRRDDKLVKNKCPLNRRSCIGCDYVISLRYFIYVFEEKFKQILTKYEKAKSELDKEIITKSITNHYIPLLKDLTVLLEKEEVSKVIDINRYNQLKECN